jgi:hypothetical protein
MSTADFPGVRWRGHWVAPDVPEFVIDPTSVGSDLPPAEFSRAQFRRVFDVEMCRRGYRSACRRIPGMCCGSTVPRLAGVRFVRSRDDCGMTSTTSRPMRPGRNVLAALVTYYGHANSFWQPAASSGVMCRDAQLVVEARVSDEWSLMSGGGCCGRGRGLDRALVTRWRGSDRAARCSRMDRVTPRPGTIERLAGVVPTPHELVRVEVEDGQVRVDSPVPVRFVSQSGENSSAAAGHSELTL